MPSLRVIHLLSSDRYTGPAEPVCNLIGALSARGHRVWMALMPGRSLEKHAREREIPLVEDMRLDRGFAPKSKWRDIHTLSSFVSREKIDLVHCHTSTDHWLTALAKQLGKLSAPVVRTQHRIPSASAGLLQRWLWRGSDAVINVARCQLERCTSQPPCGLHLVPGAVDSDSIHPGRAGADVRETLGIPHSAPVVGMISHFKAGRGWTRAVAAMISVHRRRPEVHFILAGGHSRLVKWIRAQMREAGCMDQTHIISGRELAWPEILAAMDMSLWLAVQSDGSGRAMLEVMAAGRPVIAARVGAAPDTIADGENGVLVPADVTPERLASEIDQLIADEPRRRQLGENARRTIETRHTLPIQAQAVERVYEKVISERSAAR